MLTYGAFTSLGEYAANHTLVARPLRLANYGAGLGIPNTICATSASRGYVPPIAGLTEVFLPTELWYRSTRARHQ